MSKKYELLVDDKITFLGREIFRIKALISFGSVEKGDVGGYIEKEENLSLSGDAWVSGNARVYGDAMVSGDAEVSGNAWVSGNARVYGNAEVSGDARVSGDAEIYGDAWVSGDAMVSGDAEVSGNARVYGDAEIYGNAEVSGNARVSGDAEVSGNAWVSGNAEVSGDAEVSGIGDVVVFKNNWSSGRCFTYTKSNKMWCVGCFYGSGQELIDKAYKDSEKSGDFYRAYVDFVETLEKIGDKHD